MLKRWVDLTLPLAIGSYLIAPWIFSKFGPAAGCVWLQNPIYMLHQHEEHVGDRFAKFANQLLAKRDDLPFDDLLIFLINVGLVWGFNFLAFYLVCQGWVLPGLIAICVTLFNGWLHAVWAIKLRRYNPGLGTSLALFLPLGGLCLKLFLSHTAPSPTTQVAGWLGAIALHALIVFYIFGVRLKSMPEPQAEPRADHPLAAIPTIG